MTTTIRTLVVDDEKLARDRLTGFLSKLDGVQVIGQATNGVEAVACIERDKPDLVFLDVQMPGMDGFDVVKALDPPRPHVVFATAFDDYAIRAFEVEAIDYLLKPFARTRVEDAVSRVRTRLDRGGAGLDVENVLKRLDDERKDHLRQVPVHAAKRILLVAVEDIHWFGVEYRLVYAHTAERAYMTNFTLRELEERLEPEMFFRAHKGSLVNMRQVKEVVPWFGGRFKLVMRDQEASEVPVSRAQSRTLRAKLRW